MYLKKYNHFSLVTSLILCGACILYILGNKAIITNNTETVTTETSVDVSTLEECELVRVVDGDTIIVLQDTEEIYVRLIGIDTPESVNPDESKNTEEGIQASEHTKELLSDVDTVYLEYDVETEDDYGRTLAYVYYYNADNNCIMLNEKIMADGYADTLTIQPNTKYASVFERYVKEENKEIAK